MLGLLWKNPYVVHRRGVGGRDLFSGGLLRRALGLALCKHSLEVTLTLLHTSWKAQEFLLFSTLPQI